jgi:hypothetical protein
MNQTTNLEPNVTTEQGLRDLVESGHVVEVLCQSNPVKKGPSWHGTWVMRTVGKDGRERVLVTARTRTSRNDIKIREFKTATGVISFLVGIGFTHASLPMKTGHRTSHSLSED